MNGIRVFLATLVFTAAAANASGSIIADTNKFPEKVVPGTTFTLTGTFDATAKDVVFKLYVLGTSTPSVRTFSGTVAADGKSVAVTLPDKLDPGRYYLTVNYQGATEMVPGELRVVPDAVQLDSARPTTAYKNLSGSFDFNVIGRNFSAIPQDNNVYVEQDPIIKSWASRKEDCKNKTPQDLPCLWVDRNDPAPKKLHIVGYQPEGYQLEHYQGPLSFSVSVGSIRSEEKQLVLSRMSEAGVLFLSVAIFSCLAFIIYRLVARGMRDIVIDGKHYSPFWSFFIDRETNAYSLSRLQFSLFFFVFVFGYIYIFLSGWLARWEFGLPNVPGQVAAVLGVCTGTLALGKAKATAHGTKAAESHVPTAADFVTVDGQWAPERLQFFVWTLIACFGFILLLLAQDPSENGNFPQLPKGVLLLAGVSATTYKLGDYLRKR